MDEVVPVRVSGERTLEVLDQTLLPHEVRYRRLGTLDAVCEAIRVLRVRGAPLLGIVGAYGVAVGAVESGSDDESLARVAATLMATRPTAADLGAVALRAVAHARAISDVSRRVEALWQFADAFAATRRADDRAMAALGAPLLGPGARVLTHCNTGALATGGIGSGLGLIRGAWEAGRLEHCYATETRPLLQGARLTAWELKQLGIPATLLPDTAAASLIASGRVTAVVTGADRIGANGDSANKVGTYGLAVLAARHNLPFYIAAPRTTVDVGCASGAEIPIEFRDGDEVGGFGGVRWAPDGLGAYNPAFDVTPAALITAIVTERAVVWPPFGPGLAALYDQP